MAGLASGRSQRRSRAGLPAAAGAAVLAAGALSYGSAFVSQAITDARSAVGSPMAASSAQPRPRVAGADVMQLATPTMAMLGLGLLHVSRAPSRSARRMSFNNDPEGGDDIEDLVPFELRGFSLAKAVLAAGVLLTVVSFGDYFVYGAGGGAGIGGLTFIYAVPVFLLGAALQYAELLPVEVETKPGAEGLFDQKATKVLKGIIKDVTRHRYGDDAHLDSSLKALGLVASNGKYPQMRKIIVDKSADGELEFTMVFESKDVPFTTWGDPMKTRACDRFFSPGVWSEIYKYDAEKKMAALKLTTGTRPETVASTTSAQVPATA